MTDFSPKAAGQPLEKGVQADEVGRRTILIGATTALFATSIVWPERAAHAADPPSDADLRKFTNLSAALIGVARDKLLPNVDEPNLKTDYFIWLRDRAQPTFGRLLQMVPADASDEQIQKLVVDTSKNDAEIRYLTRSITLLWYLGTWYAPATLKALAEAPDPNKVTLASEILSSKAYINGWIWRVMQAHPMGYSDMQFGYWASVPAPLKSFIGGTQS
jgi:hypothetical protein